MITFNIVESNSVLVKKIHTEIANHINQAFNKSLGQIKDGVKRATIEFFKNTDTFQALVFGPLNWHFGFPAGTQFNRAYTVVEQIGENIQLDFNPFKISRAQYKGGLKLQVLQSDFSDILGLPEASVVTEKGTILPWLRWLLLEGNAFIIKEYDIRLESGQGRSGGAVMINDKAGVWRVPPEYAGTANNNWLTRTIIQELIVYEAIVDKIVQTYISRVI